MTDLFYEGRDLEVLAEMPRYYDWIMDAFAPHVRGRVVEYGAGAGTVSMRLEPLADRLTLVELSTNLVETLQQRFRNNPEVDVISRSLEEHAAELGAEAVDTVVMVNVLEHIEDDRAALADLVRILRPGGSLLLFVPALQFLMSELDLMHGHFRRYQRGDLAAKVEAAGARVEVCRYFDFAGVVPWLLLNKMLGSTDFNPRLIGIHDRYVVPVSRAAERVVTPPWGKNVILIAKRPIASARP
ncbi:MAG TPA: class I SAM-dependent methyltransferase [Methyloceanibacter sp.]|nr:class I SAM-dependent methyltransferase [Methyloceanibacter sp.]